ncbi:nucleotidyltransferase domain-containing protein [Diaminobutyricibacter sp. McL0618]|uniref:nucleotidyltransferase domain-containing protein n=1 Tax=Leifsonia sp. McL0618 TaxID=3415677 RepID=UPI003CF5D43F
MPDSLDPAVVAEIDDRLLRVEADNSVRVPWAIESGSRAWGFPSPDSDYDCRFIFVRPATDYLSLWQKRDVIETPLDKTFDVNGWDLAKALRLLLKGNAVVVEWLNSPIIYAGDPVFRDGLLALASEVSDPVRVGRHYLHVGRREWPGEAGDVSLKKVFYAMRPACALRWLRLHPGEATPPMDLPTLLAEISVEGDVLEEAAHLIEVKARTREMGRGEFPAALAEFTSREFEYATEAYEDARTHIDPAKTERVDDYFRMTIERLNS